MVTHAGDGCAAQVGVGTMSLCADLIEVSPTSARGEILIKRVHCVLCVLLSGVYVRRGLAFLYVINVIIVKIRSCLCRKALHSLGRGREPNGPGEARHRI